MTLNKKYSCLFEPVKIGKLELKNRIAMAPMGAFGLVTLQGAFSNRAVDYYVERAKGGTGLIITSLVRIENEIEKGTPSLVPCLINPAHFIQQAAEMTEKVHAYGSRIFVQLTGGFGRVAHPGNILSHPVAPSPIPSYFDPRVICRELTTKEVEKLVEAFGAAARIAVQTGFDGVEVHAVHESYLIDQFTMSMFNKRKDKYGGDLEGRLRFPIEIVQKIKSEAGKDFPVQLRYSIKSYIKDWGKGGLPGEEFKEMGRDVEEGLQVAKILEAVGYDSFNADAGSYDAFYWAHPPPYQKHGLYLPLTQKLKEVVKVPVLVAGRMEIPGLAASAIAEQKADIIVLGRGLLADPDWANKVRQDNIEFIRPCLACHDGCADRGIAFRPLSCAVNPGCGREAEYSLRKTDFPQDVMVVGGGVAGMEAARVAAIRGHHVSLYEKNNQLGGHLLAASVPAFKEDIARLLRWYDNELCAAGVNLRLGEELSAARVKKEKPDVLILATGSGWCIPRIKGINQPKVVTASALLLNQKNIKDPVAIIGGGLTGCETALWLAQQDKKVTIIEMLDEPMCSGPSVPHMNKIMLLDLLKFHNVEIFTGVKAREVTETGVETLDCEGKVCIVSAKTVVLAAGLKPRQDLYRGLRNAVSQVYLIGDARQPRNIMSAIWDAYEIARNI